MNRIFKLIWKQDSHSGCECWHVEGPSSSEQFEEVTVCENAEWTRAFENQKKYVLALEATRRDLWGVNEELRDKIGALERGSEDAVAQRDLAWKELRSIRKTIGALNTEATSDEVLALWGVILAMENALDLVYRGTDPDVMRSMSEIHKYATDGIEALKRYYGARAAGVGIEPIRE